MLEAAWWGFVGGAALLIGAAIGISLVGGGSVGLAMLLAVFLSNIPESMSASAGLIASGRRPTRVSGCGLR